MSTIYPSANPHSTQPETPTHAAPGAFAPGHDLLAQPLTGMLKRAGTWPRLMLLACGGLMCLCFFTPQFYASLSVKDAQVPAEMRTMYDQSWWLFGWSTWWGILSFLLAFFTTIGVAGDLLLGHIKALRTALRRLYPAVWGLLTLTTGLGILLGLFGVGLGAASRYAHIESAGPTAADLSLFRLPIMALPLLLVTLAALAISGVMLWKECATDPGAKMPAVQAPAGKPGASTPST